MSDTALPDHASLMDRIYRHQRHIYDLTRKYYLLGRDRLIRELDARPGAHVLEIGCGTGRNLIAAARRYPEARFCGLDISDEMLETARAAVARAGLSDRITLARADAAGFDAARLFGRAHFDRVFVSYALSMIPPWQAVLQAALDATRPGGRLLIVDFGQQASLPGWFRTLLQRWLAAFHVTPRADLVEACQRAAAEHGCSAETRSLYRDYAWLVTLRRS